MLNKIRFRTKMFVLTFILTMSIFSFFSMTSYSTFKHTLISDTFKLLDIIKETKKSEMNAYFSFQFELLDDVKTNLRFTNGLPEISAAIKHGMDHPLFKKEIEKQDPGFIQYLKTHQFNDILLFDSTGRVIYSVQKGPEVGLNANQLSEKFPALFRLFNQSKIKNTFEDFSIHPISEKPAAYFGTPIYIDHLFAGVAAFQIQNQINQIMTDNYHWEKEGLGETGETFLVGPDFSMRSESRFFIRSPDIYYQQISAFEKDTASIEKIKKAQSTVLHQNVNTDGTHFAFAGKDSTGIFNDYRGVEVLSSFSPLHVPEINWVILAEMDKDEVLKPLTSASMNYILMWLASIIISIVTSLTFTYLISTRINRLAQIANNLAIGKLFNKKEMFEPEFLSLFDSLSLISNNYLKVTQHAKTISEGNLDNTFSPRSSEDELAKSLNSMTMKLKDNIATLSNLEKGMNQSAIVAMTDIKGKITFVNDYFCQISQYSKEELLGQDHRILNSNFHSKSFMSHLWNTIKSGKVWKGEIRNKAKDGSLYWVNTSIIPQLDKRGYIEGFLAIRFDITEKKFAEDRLKKSQLSTLNLLQDMKHSDRYRDSRIKSIVDVLGQAEDGDYSIRENILGKNDIFDSLATKTNSMIERVSIRNKELELGKMFVDTVINTIPDGVLVVSNDVIISKNKSIDTILAHISNIPIGSPVQNALLNFPAKTLDLIQNTDNFEHHEVVIENESNSQFLSIHKCDLETHISDNKDDGVSPTKLLVFTDITAEKDQMLKRQELEIKLLEQSKLASIGEMATGVAHEINQPLTYISGLLQNYEMNYAKDNSTSNVSLESIKTANHQVDRISDIITHLRTFGRKNPSVKERVNLLDVLSETMILLKERIHLQNIKLIKNIPDSIPDVFGSHSQIEQIFINLITNAVDAFEQNDGDRNIEVSMKPFIKKQLIEIRFKNNGPIIPKEIKSKIFDPFFTTKSTGKGTGLGLSIIYGIVQDHQGEIECISNRDEGTIFSVKFPIYNEKRN